MRRIVGLAVLFILSVVCVKSFADDCDCGGPQEQKEAQTNESGE
jgi:hypothetical protein